MPSGGSCEKVSGSHFDSLSRVAGELTISRNGVIDLEAREQGHKITKESDSQREMEEEVWSWFSWFSYCLHFIFLLS